MTQRTILDVEWVVLEETPPPPAAEPSSASAEPAAPEPRALAHCLGRSLLAPRKGPTEPLSLLGPVSDRASDLASPGDAPAIRPWAKPLLTGSLVLAALWLAAMLIIIFDGALFADSTVRLTLGLTGIPIPCLLAIAFVADPDYDSDAEETYWTWSSYPVGPCTPSRANTLTGRSDQ